MTSLTLQMTATGSSLPTAWLAPPPGLLPTNQKVKITPVPIAISATIALIIGALVMLLFNRKHKDVYLSDKPAPVPKKEEPKAPAEDNPLHISSPVEVRVPSAVQYALSHINPPTYQHPYRPPPTFPRAYQSQTQVSEWRPSGQKLDAMLGVDHRDWQHDGRMSPRRTSYIASGLPRRAYDYGSDDGTLRDDEKNSAYVPFNASEFDYEQQEKSGHGGLDSSHISEDEGSVDSVEEFGKRQRAFAAKFPLGDPY
ncbi:hypothetical protein HBH56_123790 [Parastagonospora nodorum]|uniref:Uncharacterized protein n=2 Tax=Phaeosphaeria nodorum (strain SN15 / ATCC MYA-4574 / FGSC 10173) TaxID=321614 RepID=A0A7U2HUF3_PHANO|nr:hypothetical protein HBH56_123790 [Parastagonospora nodorum]QRC91153.1 hypothetical protein JI435_006520 [Parastagonospora nodorum SN15]KAH3934982.1 hypothetical protein HBH54_049330 [Parastagonospora nodorum]KAH3950270.1 hypothetical protein HBH53_080030 [Parastagonospora nodorum]KAH3987635.1 hypothetical protein HBH52_039600 [Parastagonospora nodorum]